MKECPKNVNKRHNWVLQIKDYYTLQDLVTSGNSKQLLVKNSFFVALKLDAKICIMQQCLGNINASSRCRLLYRNLKEDFELAPYLRKNKNKDLRQCQTKIRLSGHKFFIERGRWLKPKVEYCDRLCTLCERRDIEDEYHIILPCPHYKSVRLKFIRKEYHERPSMRKFSRLLTTTNDRDLHKLMKFIKLVLKITIYASIAINENMCICECFYLFLYYFVQPIFL